MSIIRIMSAVGLLSILVTDAQAQSWLGFNAAVPKVAPGYGTGVTVTTPGVAPPPANIASNTSPTGVTSNFSVAPSLVPTSRPWKLGVVVRNTDIGAVVQTVEPSSAAQQAGIVPGDVIIAVSGTRIGEFDGRVVDIGEEIKRYTDGYGRVSLLIQDSRTKALRASVVTLTAATLPLTGLVSVSDRQVLPVGSVLTVQLQNITRPFYEVAGGKAVLRAEGQGPFRFDLFVDQRYLPPTDKYQLNAYISWNNQLLYTLRQPISVPANGLNQMVNLVLDPGSSIGTVGSFTAAAPPAFTNPATLSPATTPNPPATTIPTTVAGGTAGTVTASLPATPTLPGAYNTDALNQVFTSLLGRAPSSRELIAWQSYMQQGHTLNEVAAKLMASPQFRERYATDPAFVQQVIQTLTGKIPTTSEINYWVGRMQTLGSPEKMIEEILAQTRKP